MDEAIELRLNSNEQRIAELTKTINEIKEEMHRQDKEDINRTHELKYLITTAVQEGNKETNEAINSIREELHTRLLILERKDEVNALEEKKEKANEKKENKRHITKTILVAIVSFFSALILNNLVTVLLSYLNK